MRYLAAEGEKQHLAEQSPLKEQLKYIFDRLMEGAVVNQIRESYNVAGGSDQRLLRAQSEPL